MYMYKNDTCIGNQYIIYILSNSFYTCMCVGFHYVHVLPRTCSVKSRYGCTCTGCNIALKCAYLIYYIKQSFAINI